MKAAVLRWAAPAVILFCIFLAITLPARHVLGWLGLGQVAMQGVEGTLWSGRIDRLGVGRTVVGPLAWRLRPTALLAGRLEYQVFVQSGSGGGELRAGRGLFGGPYLADVQLSLPAADVARQLPLAMVQTGGDFLLDVRRARFETGWLRELDGLLTWQGAKVLQPAPLELGTLTMQLGLREGQMVGTLGAAAEGPLELGGEFRLGPDRRYALDALAKPRAAASPDLRQSLGLLGNPDALGRYRLQLSGAL